MSSTHALFNDQAQAYALARPTYPEQLFDWLSDQTQAHELAIDCATGSGQAIAPLAQRYQRVIGLDISAEQLKLAPPHPRVTYQHKGAEDLDAAPASVDLITVATALHWFDLPRFYAKVRQVLKPDGLLAAWCYGSHKIDDEPLHQLTSRYATQLIGPYWRAENMQLTRTGYQEIIFPFHELTPPLGLTITRALTAQRYLDYLASWSASASYLRATGQDPIDTIKDEVFARWHERTGDATQGLIEVSWPLFMRAGRV